MIIVTGSVTGRPETFEALLEACVAHVVRSRREPGCISHSVQVDCENPMRLFFFERWTDEAALKIHFGQAGTADFLAEVRRHGRTSEAVTIYKAAPTSVV